MSPAATQPSSTVNRRARPLAPVTTLAAIRPHAPAPPSPVLSARSSCSSNGASYADVLAGRKRAGSDCGSQTESATSGSDVFPAAQDDVSSRSLRWDDETSSSDSGKTSLPEVGTVCPSAAPSRTGEIPASSSLASGENKAVAECIAPFPDGKIRRFIADTSSCSDWNFHADWCWRSHHVEDVSHYKHGDGQCTVLHCRGALVCQKCEGVQRAPTSNKGSVLKRWIDKGCAKKSCRGPLAHVKCKAQLKLTQFDCGSGLYEHKGKHTHAEPPCHKPRPSNLAELEKLVVEKPAVKAKGLSLGRAKGPSRTTIKIPAARDIDDALINLGRLSYYRLKFLKKNGIQPIDGSRDANFLLFLQMQQTSADSQPSPTDFTDPTATEADTAMPTRPVAIRHASFTHDRFAVVLQTDWQREMFANRDRMSKVMEADGHAGILTDVTFKVFENFYLCTSSIFSHTLGRWVPILWTVLRQQREADFADHFYHLFRSLQEQNLAQDEIEALMGGTVDFSQAQRAGFISAYVRWRTEASGMGVLTSKAAREAEQDEYAARGLTLLKGCFFHFRQSVHRVQSNGNFVPKEDQARFGDLIASLLSAKCKSSIVDVAAQLFTCFPNCYDWLTWWLSCDTAAMLFPGLKLMPLSSWRGLPSSISALENLHSIYYLCWSTNMDLMCGLQCLQELADLLEAETEAEEAGKATRYGKTGIRALKKPRAKAKNDTNDGRAPDANALLPEIEADRELPLPSSADCRARKRKGKTHEDATSSKRARPAGPVQASSDPVPPVLLTNTITTTTTSSISKQIGKKAGKGTSRPSLVYGKMQVRSYAHANNTCFVTSLLEILFIVFLSCQPLWEALLPRMVDGGGLKIVTISLQKRQHAYGALKTAEARAKHIDASLQMVVDFLIQEKAWYKFLEHGNWWWFTRAVAEEPDYEVQSFFAFTQQEHRTCGAHSTFAHPLMTICDLEFSHYSNCASITEGVQEFVHRQDSLRCRANLLGLDRCEADSLCTTSTLRLPHVLFVSLPPQPQEAENCWSSEVDMSVQGLTYRLAGRVVSTSPDGMHYTALTYLPHPLGPYAQAGIYSFDDRNGVATLRRGATPEAVLDELARVPLSTCAIYVATTAVGDPRMPDPHHGKASTAQARSRAALKLQTHTVLGLQRFQLTAMAAGTY